MNFAIIPARKGSKRLRNKNRLLLGNNPIISYPIISALKSKIFKEVIVSTDCKIIANISKEYGAIVPRLREKSLSGDNVNLNEVVRNEIKLLQRRYNKVDNIFCILPTSPFIDANLIKNSFNKFQSSKCSYLFSVIKINSKYSRSFFFKKNKLKMINKKFYSYRSQDLPEIYQDAGKFYWAKAKNWLRCKKIFNKNSKIYTLPHWKGIDIDYPEDFKIVKNIYEKKIKN